MVVGSHETDVYYGIDVAKATRLPRPLECPTLEPFSIFKTKNVILSRKGDEMLRRVFTLYLP